MVTSNSRDSALYIQWKPNINFDSASQTMRKNKRLSFTVRKQQEEGHTVQWIKSNSQAFVFVMFSVEIYKKKAANNG